MVPQEIASRLEQTLPQLHDFDAISLTEMEEVALLNRVDSKFIIPSAQIIQLLPLLTDWYRILTIDQRRQHRYRTLYFDTVDFALYQRHHAGARQRYKVRSRQYRDTDLSFFEIKCKINSNRTQKHRIQTKYFMTDWNDAASDFMELNGLEAPATYLPVVSNDFTRITLVHQHTLERITLDLQLGFTNDTTNVALEHICIIEIKQAVIDHQSPFLQQLRTMNLHQRSFSKYCVGVALLYPNIKHNTIKPALQRVFSLMGGIHE